VKNTFAMKNKRIKFLKNQSELKDKVLKIQQDSIDTKDRSIHILEVEVDRLKDELKEELISKEWHKLAITSVKLSNDKYYETSLLSESRCNKKSLHIKILYAVIISLSLFFWIVKWVK